MCFDRRSSHRGSHYVAPDFVLTSREIDNTFKKINEGLELFNYYYERHQDLESQPSLDKNMESQKEKLENDLKKEIKKLQKNRELIKNWQSNESVEVICSPVKLQEYRKLVEEAMERYKEVEKSSKMKSFSNQSIMLAALDDEQNNLSKEEIEVLTFLNSSIDEINSQIEELESEYEKISSKKIRKNNSSTIESEKQEIEGFLTNNRFHLEKFEDIVDFVKAKRIDPESVWKIKDDINFYLESNQEPDFIDDETLYDEIFSQAESNYTYSPKKSPVIAEAEADLTLTPVHSTAANPVLPNLKSEKSKSPSPSTPVKRSHEFNVTPIKHKPATPDLSSPAIIKTLKPATTPAKISGEVAWSSAVGASVPQLEHNGNGTKASDSGSPLHQVSTLSATRTLSPDQKYYNYVEVLQNSQLAESELQVLSDPNLVKLPAGIQNLILSFTAARTTTDQPKLMEPIDSSSQFSIPIKKPFLPAQVQNSFYQYSKPGIVFIKPPLHLLNYQNYWNRIRANDEFDIFTNEIAGLINQLQHPAQANAPQPSPELINELTLVLFYGFYYGLTPLENLIAESKLFELGWKPYGIKNPMAGAQDPSRTAAELNAANYFYWFKSISADASEQGDFQVFDLNTWEVHVKSGFRLDASLVQAQPATAVA